MKSEGQILVRARQILADAALKSPQHATTLKGINLRVSSRMTRCAGTANYGKHEITLSLPFMADPTNFENKMFEIVTHEAAHLLVGRARRERKPHGPLWQSIHRSIGGTGKRTHSMALADGFKGRERKTRTSVPCPCGCGQTMTLGPTQIKRHDGGDKYYIKGHAPRRQRATLDDFFRF